MPQTTGLSTLLDVATSNAATDQGRLLEEAARPSPEISGVVRMGGQDRSIPGLGLSGTIDGIDYQTLIVTADPVVGFRDVDQGVDYTKPTYANRRFTAYTLNPRWGMDKAAANREKGGPGVLMERAARAHLRAAMRTAAGSLYYGWSSGGLVVPGLNAVVTKTNGDGLQARSINAGGTTNNTASSVWAIKWGEDYVRWLVGNNGDWQFSDLDMRDMEDANGKKFTGWHQELTAHIGVQCNTPEAVGVIRNLTADTGKGLTDSLLSQLMELFEDGFEPDCIMVNKRSLFQLQRSRTATSPTGAEAPIPMDYMGIPIVRTPNITITEPLVTISA